MPAYRDKRSGRWRYRKRIRLTDGRMVRIEGTPTINTKTAAEHAESAHIFRTEHPEAVKAAQPEQKKEVPTLDGFKPTFLARYESGKPSALDAMKNHLRAHISPRFGHRRLDGIIQSDVDVMVNELLERKLGRKSINNILATLSSLLKLAARNRLITKPDLIMALKVEETELVALTEENIKALLAVAEPRYQAAILLASDAGLRVGEIRGLRWSDIDELRRELRVWRSVDARNRTVAPKHWKGRAVPLSDRLWAALKKLDSATTQVITRLDGGPISYWALREGIQSLYTQAQFTAPSLPWHALRHTFCTRLADRGVPLHVIRELAGHRSIETTLRYTHTNADSKRDAVRIAFGRQMGDSSPRKEKTAENFF